MRIPAGALDRLGGEHGHRGAAIVAEVMLREPDRVVAELLGILDLLDLFVEGLGLPVAHGWDQNERELHGYLPDGLWLHEPHRLWRASLRYAGAARDLAERVAAVAAGDIDVGAARDAARGRLGVHRDCGCGVRLTSERPPLVPRVRAP